jgi:hypothetical protein
VTAQATNNDGDVGPTPMWSEDFDTKCAATSAVVLAAGLNSSLDPSNNDGPFTPQCNNDHATFPSGTDGFDSNFAGNACDAQGVANGNLISYLTSKGYVAGTSRSAPNRTLLEFSYNGADVDCGTGAGPTFVPRAYSIADTYKELASNLSVDSTETADAYVEALKQYSDCWQQDHGTPLSFTIIGHSEGGYEALAIARAAEVDGYKGLISGIISIDGAIQPYSALYQLNAGSCLATGGFLHLPADVAGWLNQKVNWAYNVEYNVGATHLTGLQIQSVQNYGIRVATLTNNDDPCLYNDTTLNPAANYVQYWDINYGSGTDEHGAALTSHGNDINVDTPGYPLVDQFLRWSHFVDNASVPVVTPSARPAFAASPSAVDTGDLRGRVVDPNTQSAIADGTVILSGADGAHTGDIGQDGTFSLSGLRAGQYKVYVAPADPGLRGAWVGGTTQSSATAFSVGSSTTDIGDISASAPGRLALTLTDPHGQPITDGYAGLIDSNGRTAAQGKADDHGEIDLQAPPGHYTLEAISPASELVSEDLNLAGSDSKTIELAPGTQATVTVEDQQGQPLPGVAVALYSGNTVVRAGFSLPDGRYVASGLPSGDYTARLYEPLGRFDLPSVTIPVQTVVGDPTAGSVAYTVDMAAPSVRTPPAVLGTARQGTTLSVKHGSWSGNPTAYSYQWQQCDGSGDNCQAIAGATGASYTLRAADVAHTLRVQESATNAGGQSSPATSDATSVIVAVAPANITPPSLSGNLRIGQQLTESHGTWSNEPASYTYQWEDCDRSGNGCSPIPGATDASYTLTGADVGHALRVQETAINDGGPSLAATSDPTAVVSPPPPANSSPPTISGTARQGETLTETHGAWSNNPTSYTFQWQDCDAGGRNCVAIAGATGQSYTLLAADVGHTLQLQETAANDGGAGSPSASAATAVVLPLAPANLSAPAISGLTTPGQALTESHGAWSGSPTSYSYQWERCDASGDNCSPIDSAGAQQYILTASDIGHTLRIQESATNAGGTSSPTTSSATGVVQANPASATRPSNSSPPLISGTAQVGRMLQTTTGAWSGTAPVSYTYQWQRCKPGCLNIAGATASTLALTSTDAGAHLQVVVTASNSAGSANATSSRTGPIAGAGPTPAQVKTALTGALIVSGHDARIAQLLKHRGYVASFLAPSAGHLVISWSFMPQRGRGKARKAVLAATASVVFHRALRANVKIALTDSGRRLLMSARQLKLIENASFVPTAGARTTRTKSITLKR